MRLFHYTDSSGLRKSLHTTTLALREDMKPVGLWVSVGDEWEQWCRDENYNLGGLEQRYEVFLSPKAHILYIRSAEELDDFTVQYGISDTTIPMYHWKIDWPEVAEKYHGIIITPYLWERRLDHNTTWYYGWDCASGCIWNMKAIKKVSLIKEKATA